MLRFLQLAAREIGSYSPFYKISEQTLLQKSTRCAATSGFYRAHPHSQKTAHSKSERKYAFLAGMGIGTIATVAAALLLTRKTEKWDQGIPTENLDSIGGYQGPVQLARNLSCYLKDVKGYSQLGNVIPRTVLINGQRGRGKTHLAKAIAGEAGATFFLARTSEICKGPKSQLGALFATAEQKTPCVLCIEEVEQLGSAELNELLNLLSKERPGVLVIATTTLENSLDPLLAQWGRIDVRIPLGSPTETDRKAILEKITKNLPLNPDIDLFYLAQATWSLNTAAALVSLVAQANAHAFREKKPMAMRHILDALDIVKLGVVTEDFKSPEEKFLVASHEAGHALVGHLLGFKIQRVLLQSRSTGNHLIRGRTDWGYPYRPVGYTELTDEICVLLAGRAGEQFAGKAQTGCLADFKEAKNLAERIFAERLVPSDHKEDLESLFTRQMQRAATLLKENTGRFERIRDALFTRGKLSGPEFEALMKGEAL